eukprot:4472332-Amphidinium_carterae.1
MFDLATDQRPGPWGHGTVKCCVWEEGLSAGKVRGLPALGLCGPPACQGPSRFALVTETTSQVCPELTSLDLVLIGTSQYWWKPVER